MRHHLLLAALAFLLSTGSAGTQGISLEYQVKAGFLYNFLKFVEWPPRDASTAMVLCVAGRNPFGTVLEDTVRGESIGQRPIEVRVILEPDSGCHVVFVPAGSATGAYLRAARGAPILTVGESDEFAALGGMIRFVIDGGRVRFDINNEAATRAGLKLSSRLLRLARNAEGAR